MDLLDNLEDRGGRKFEVQYNTQIIDRATQQDSDIEDAEQSDYEEGYAEGVSDDDILGKVKQKLAQLDTPESNSTQVVEPTWDFGNSMLTQTQVIQKVAPPNHHLPQLDLNDVEFEQETQIITLKSPLLEPSSPIKEYDAESATGGSSLTQVIPLLKEERMAKISKLAELKREQRLAKEKEEMDQERERERENESLLADITHTTLTDEEEDLLEANQSVVSSDLKNPSEKSLKEVEEFLQIQKRSRNLQPQFKKKNIFTAENLLQEFNDDENDEEQSEADSNIGLSNDPENKNSPITSPVKNRVAGKYDDVEDDNQGHLPSDPISEYAHNLKSQLLSSPSKKEHDEPKMIDLDSDGDSNGGLDINDDKENNEIPALTKDEILHIKQKYLLKKISSNPKSKLIHLPKSIRNSINNQQRHNESKTLINNLQRANINQLQVHKKFNPLHDELIEMEKDEEVMGSLLERELERVRNIRKKEKLMEKAKNALLKGELASGDENSDQDDEVPDSDFDQSFNEDEDDDAEDVEDEDGDSLQEYGDVDDLKRKRKSKRVILSDDDEERKDDSYMFGAKSNDNEESLNAHHEGYITTGSSENITPTTIMEDIPIESQKYELFQNLKGRMDSTNSETQKSEVLDFEDISHLRVPSFQEIASQKDTQVLTQPDTTLATQIDGQTQKLLQNETEISNNYDNEDDDDDDITPANVRRGRILIRKNNISDIEEEEEEEEERAMNEEEVQAQVKLYEQKMRRQELKLRKKRKEMEKRGLKDIVQGEAEESEDEWHGLGGIDAELSDEQANSEDEKMIDNNFNIDLNDEEVRRKFMEQYQIKDKKDLEKLLDDIKNHKLTKRIGSKNGFDIELSDEEDELLTAYRKQRMMEQRARLLENKKMQELAKNEKSKAFFTSIQDSTLAVNIDNDDDRKTDSEVESAADEGEESEKELAMELDTKKKKTIKLKESFVQKQLSFLRTMGDDEEEVEYFKQQRISNRQYGFDSDDENLEDLQTMKRRCMESLVQGKNTNSRLTSIIDDRGGQKVTDAGDTDADDDEDDSEFIPSFKRPSLVKSFKSSNEIEVGSFTGVTIRKHYKATNGSNASISGASSNSLKKAAAKTSSLKEKRISKSISNSRNGGGLFQSNGFEN